MNKQQSTRMASLRKKLLAAIAMLLVACIMTVSSTYAWFTLSTAPEVKGISTTIGANGNLEMALGTYDTFFGSADPSSHVGSSYDATKNYVASNITWGNLVDLSDTSYGLQNITLYPTRLNSDSGKLVNRTSPLKFPVYGADGRVTELSDNTLVGSFDANSSGFINKNGVQATGVAGIGSASSMSKRAFAVLNYRAAITNKKAAAANAAKDAIRLYGGQLAAIALKNQNAGADTVVAETDIAILKDLIAKLQESNNALSDSLKSAVLLVLSSADSIKDGEWEILVGLANGKDIAEYVTALKTAAEMGGYTLPTAITDSVVGQYSAIKAKLTAASAALPPSGDGTWGNIEDSVSSLLVASGIKIGGYTISEVKTAYGTGGMGSDVVKDLFNKVSDGSLSFTFTTTSGIFADIALLTGSYTSSMAFPAGTEVEGLDLNMLGSKPVVVESGSANPTQGDIGVMYTAVDMDKLQAPAEDATADKTLTNTYGYIIDLLFRTNATESDLLLQTTAKNRYAEGAVDETMGNGSNITFTVNAEYSEAKIKDLAKAVRVVFFDNANEILAVAVLDTENGKVAGGAYKMDLKLHEFDINDEGVITINAAKADAKLCALTANVKTGISALVYLDGDKIDNSHAGVQNGLDATVNLQFASSVELKPMEDADLMGD